MEVNLMKKKRCEQCGKPDNALHPLLNKCLRCWQKTDKPLRAKQKRGGRR